MLGFLALSRHAMAQPPSRVARIGVLASTPSIAIGSAPADPAAQRLAAAFFAGLRDLGYVDLRSSIAMPGAGPSGFLSSPPSSSVSMST